MDRDALERLAMDRAGGELDADAEALLAAYLAEHPEARRTAAEMESAYRQCRDAIASRVEAAGTASPARPAGPHAWSVLAAASRPRRRSVGRWLARAAAVLAILGLGAGGGWWLGRQKGPETVQLPPGRPAVAQADEAPLDRLGPFWREKVATLLEGRPAAPAPARAPRGDRPWSNLLPPDKETIR
ncbi:MAG: hypothetical protein ISS74_01445 [Planctomycetes bacterium]|nr:hypothetical protein [Planctomycetota bacterium]